MHRTAILTTLAMLVLTVGGTAPAAPAREPTTVVVEVEGGFHWLDAGIGAAAMLAIVALGYAVLQLRRAANPERRSNG
jgi:hypothetical protein